MGCWDNLYPGYDYNSCCRWASGELDFDPTCFTEAHPAWQCCSLVEAPAAVAWANAPAALADRVSLRRARAFAQGQAASAAPGRAAAVEREDTCWGASKE